MYILRSLGWDRGEPVLKPWYSVCLDVPDPVVEWLSLTFLLEIFFQSNVVCICCFYDSLHDSAIEWKTLILLNDGWSSTFFLRLVYEDKCMHVCVSSQSLHFQSCMNKSKGIENLHVLILQNLIYHNCWLLVCESVCTADAHSPPSVCACVHKQLSMCYCKLNYTVRLHKLNEEWRCPIFGQPSTSLQVVSHRQPALWLHSVCRK